MAGLVYAAEVKGLNQSITAAGMLITNLEQLQPNNIVLLSTVSGLYHYCIITNITNTTVFLADSELGNINMTIGNFTSVYTGYVLVVTNDTNSTQFNNGTFLNYETMETIKGTNIFDNIYRNPFVNTGLNIGGYSLRVVFWPVAVVSFFAGLECVGGYNEAYYIDMWESTHSPSRNSNPPRYSPRYPKGHGSYPRSNPPTYSPPYVPPPVYPYTFWGIGLDGSYVLITGTTTGNPDDIKNQKITEAYNQKLNSELAKIAGIISQYVSNDNDYVLDKMEKNYKEGEDKLDKLISGNDPRDPKKWMERLRNALNKAVTEKKWTTVATLTAIGSLWASYYALKTFLNHK